MDASTKHHEILSRAEAAWEDSRDPVRRLAALRGLFREVHTLLNILYVSRDQSELHQVTGLHEELQHLPELLLNCPSPKLRELLSGASSTGSFLKSIQALSAPGKKRTARTGNEETPPEFLDRPDRKWEQALWRTSLGSSTWELQSIRERSTLLAFASNAAQRERDLNASGIVLAVSCLTPSGDTREWEWHLLAPKRPLRLAPHPQGLP